MNVLVIGSGGREHTIAWKFSKSEHVTNVFVAPGNSGMTDVAKRVPISEDNHEELVHFALKNEVELVFVGPEAPLLAGLVDRFQLEGRLI